MGCSLLATPRRATTASCITDSGGTFISKYDDDALKLIELVAENSHHHAAKSFGGWSAPAKRGMLDVKAAEIGMLLDKIEKLTEAHNLIINSLKASHQFHMLMSHRVHMALVLTCRAGFPMMAIKGQFPFQPNHTTYPGLSQAGRSTYPNQGYSSFHNPTYVQQRSGQHTSYHQPYGSAPQHMGNSRPTSFAPGIPRAVTPPPAIPPPSPSVDPVMSALAQMMSKLNEVSDRLDRVEGPKAQCSDASTEQRKGKRVEFSDQLPSQPLENPRNVGQASSSRTHNVKEVRIDGASEEAHAISSLRSDKVLVDPHTDHKCRKDPLEEKEDRPSPTIIPEEDSEDEEAPDEESRVEPNPEVYKPLVPYPQLLSRSKVPTNDSDDTLLEAVRQVTITIPLVDAIQHIPPYAKFLKRLCTPVRKPKRIHMSETTSSIMLSTLPRKRCDPGAPMISCEIGGKTFTQSLLDTGASVNILPKGVYDVCPLGELQPLFIELSLADGSVRRPHGVVEDVIVKVENYYFLVDFIIVDINSTKDLTDSPIILGRPFLATAKAIIDWGKGEVIFQVGDSTMKVSINKLMQHPSHEADEVGAVDIYEDPEISSCIEETMAAIEDRSFEELEDDPFPSGEMAPELKPLPSTLKYAFLDHHSANPIIIPS